MKLGRGTARTARRRAKAGYSLLEILIVLAIIALIVALVGPRLFAAYDRSRVTAARVQVKGLETALETMELDIGRYPTESEGLALLVNAPDRRAAPGWNGPYLSGALPNDPWGHPYVYDPPVDRNHPPRVHSLGPDGKPDDAIYSDAPAGPATANEAAPGGSAPSAAAAPPDSAPKTP